MERDRIPIVEEWKASARLQEKRKNLRLVLRERFETEVPDDLQRLIGQMTDEQMWLRWFKAALKQSSLEAFREAVKGDHPRETTT